MLKEWYKNGWNGKRIVKLHRLIAEQALGKPLPKNSIVHHVDGGYTGSLIICQDQAYHLLLHLRKRAYLTCGNPHYRQCEVCKQFDEIPNMRIHFRERGNFTYHHVKCDNERRRKLRRKNEGAPLCLCGCGEKVFRNVNGDKYAGGMWNQYVVGHANKGRNRI